MQERIRRRQSDRRYELEMEEAVAMACKANRRPTLPTTTRKMPSRESVIVATGTAAIVGAALCWAAPGQFQWGMPQS